MADMAQFTVNARRFDPYKNFKFRIKWDGKYVAGLSKMGALKRTTEVVKHREGGDPSSSRKSPGRTEYDALTLDRSKRGPTRCGASEPDWGSRWL
jgi:phage tail-like protein